MFTAYASKVERMTTTGFSDTGSPIKTKTTIHNSVVLDISEQKQEVIQSESGMDVVVDTRITCPLGTDIKADDIITNLVDGVRYKVVSVIKRTLLNYLEIKGQKGVL